MAYIYHFNKYAYISEISLKKNLQLANVLMFSFLTFVIWVLQDGSDEPNHVAHCCLTMECCLFFNYSKHNRMNSSNTTDMNTVTSLTGECQWHILNHHLTIAYNNITNKRHISLLKMVTYKFVSYMFRPTRWSSSGRYTTKDGYTGG